MDKQLNCKRIAQLFVVLLCALFLKLAYSTASPNELRWILAPTTALVELVSGKQFEFESHAGYMSSDRSFLIAASCAGVNFLITSFLMLTLGKLWRDRLRNAKVNSFWRFIPVALVCAYLATLVANTVRISTALRLQRMPLEISWLTGNQLHRLKGIVIYFGFLLLLFAISERMSSSGVVKLTADHSLPCTNASLFRKSLFPLMIYYATTLGIPLATGFYRGTPAADFLEHSVFVLLAPLILLLPFAVFRVYAHWRNNTNVRLVATETLSR